MSFDFPSMPGGGSQSAAGTQSSTDPWDLGTGGFNQNGAAQSAPDQPQPEYSDTNPGGTAWNTGGSAWNTGGSTFRQNRGAGLTSGNQDQLNKMQGYQSDSHVRRVKPQISMRPPIQPIHIPWGLLLSVIAIIAIIAFLYIYRYEVTQFIAQLLSWAIAIIIFLFILRAILRSIFR